MSRALNLPGKTGRWIVRNGYLIAERIVGFKLIRIVALPC